MSNKPDPTHLAWIDLETTGLDMENGKIIEVALIVTDMDLAVLEHPFNAVIGHEGVLDLMDDFVTNMHTESGLLPLLTDLSMTWNESKVRRDIENILAFYAEPQKWLIAGSGVQGFDLPWIKHHWPEIGAYFQYASLDIGTVRRYVKYIARRPDLIPEQKEKHRALPDIEEFLETARNLRPAMEHGFHQISKQD